jgi:hypothetical protein
MASEQFKEEHPPEDCGKQDSAQRLFGPEDSRPARTPTATAAAGRRAGRPPTSPTTTTTTEEPRR